MLEIVFSIIMWPWSRDMFQQPNIKPQEKPIVFPTNSVPRSGYVKLPFDLDEAEKISNPVTKTVESLKRGEKLFKQNCSMCHGEDGSGNGPVSQKFIPPPDLSTILKARSDGFLYRAIKLGGATAAPGMPPQGIIMPPYRRNLTDEEVWDIVNWLRKLER